MHPIRRHSGFTLAEVLLTLALLLVIFVVVANFVEVVQTGWTLAEADPFAEAADASDTLARSLAGATLEPYEDYADSTGAFRGSSQFVPDHLARRSDLAFRCGPAAGPTGLLASSGINSTGSAIFYVAPMGYSQSLTHQGVSHLLVAEGCYVEFGDDTGVPAFFSGQGHAWRWRLKWFTQASEALQIYATTSSADWIQKTVPACAPEPVAAENIITFLALPDRAVGDVGNALSPNFGYDSRDTSNATTLHQLPPRLRLILVAMDRASALRLAAQNGASAPSLVPGTLFQEAAQLEADLATLDASLTARRIGHRFFQREISLSSSSWSNTAGP